MQSLEDEEPVVSHSMTESQPPDLVQLTTTVLEESLSCVKSVSRTRLIASAMSVLSALPAFPNYSNRGWLYIRSLWFKASTLFCVSCLVSRTSYGSVHNVIVILAPRGATLS